MLFNNKICLKQNTHDHNYVPKPCFKNAPSETSTTVIPLYVQVYYKAPGPCLFLAILNVTAPTLYNLFGLMHRSSIPTCAPSPESLPCRAKWSETSRPLLQLMHLVQCNLEVFLLTQTLIQPKHSIAAIFRLHFSLLNEPFSVGMLASVYPWTAKMIQDTCGIWRSGWQSRSGSNSRLQPMGTHLYSLSARQ